MEERNEETPVFLDRSSRATRGKRMTKLLDDELEEDEMFWSQEALKEEENDDQYEEEEGGEVADEFDSDFNDDVSILRRCFSYVEIFMLESEPDNDVVNDVEDRTRPKKRLIFPGKAFSKKKKKTKKDLSQINKTQKEEKLSNNSRPLHDIDAPDDTEGEKSVRKSTRTAVIVKQAERDAIRAALQPIAKPIKRKKEGEEKRVSQEEMLLEAAQTEIMNLRNLERVLAREEEVKKRAVVHKAVYTGPQIRYISKAGKIPFTIFREL
ncbi:SWR1 complex subunit 2-like protein [Drosera capensis]